MLPQWKQPGWPRWDISLSWKGLYSGKMRTKIRWIFFAHHKKIIMGEGGRIAVPVHNFWKSISPQWKLLGCPRWDIILNCECPSSTKWEPEIGGYSTYFGISFLLFSYLNCSYFSWRRRKNISETYFSVIINTFNNLTFGIIRINTMISFYSSTYAAWDTLRVLPYIIMCVRKDAWRLKNKKRCLCPWHNFLWGMNRASKKIGNYPQKIIFFGRYNIHCQCSQVAGALEYI